MTADEPRWEATPHGGSLVVTAHGRLDSVTYLRCRDTLVKFAMGQPDSLIVVVDDLIVVPMSAWTAFSSAWMTVSDWPGVRIMLVSGDARQRAGCEAAVVSKFVPVFADVAAALQAVRSPPARRRAEVTLMPLPTSSREARVFVRATCDRWSISPLAIGAAEIATELVENSIVHARTELRLRLEFRQGMLTVAVSDGSPASAVLRETSGDEDRSFGLVLVAHRARAWGCAPEWSGGKTVWAVLTIPRFADTLGV